MRSSTINQTFALVLSTLLLIAAVPSLALCLCNDSTPQCCDDQSKAPQGPDCCKSLLGEAASSISQLSCSMESIPSNAVNDSHPCKHLEGLSGSTAATVPVGNSEDLSDSSKTACGAVLPLYEIDSTSISVSLRAVSSRDVAPLAPAYLLFASLII
jgi:hypothetical protein